MTVLELETGQMLEYCQLRRHPKYQHTWNKYYYNDLSRLHQGIVTSPSGAGPCVKVTDTLFIINFEDTPPDRLKEVTDTKSCTN